MVEMYIALLAASAPALKPFFRRFLIEPIGTAINSSQRRQNDNYGERYGATASKGKTWSNKASTNRGSAALNDPERIGVAYGGSDMTKSREESFVREVDDDYLETKHFELRQSRDGKIVPMQVWKKSSTPAPTAPLPSIPRSRQNVSEDRQGHVRNFSQPHSYGSTDTTAVPSRGPSQQQRRTSMGSVKAGRMAAQHHIASAQGSFRADAPASQGPTSSNSKQSRVPRRGPPSSDTDSELEYCGTENPPWNDIRSASKSRSGSDETLRLPRMGSREHFGVAQRDYAKPQDTATQQDFDVDPERGTRWGHDIGHGR